MNFEAQKGYYQHRGYFLLPQLVRTPKTRSFAWLSLSIFTISFFLIVAIQPTLVTIVKLNREIKDKTEASQKLQNKIDAIVAAQNEFAKNSDNLPLLEQALPEKSLFPRFAYFIEEEAAAWPITLKSLLFEKIGETKKTSKQDTSPQANFFNFNLAVTGDYPILKSFLKELESSRRIIQIESSVFNQTSKEEPWVLSLSIQGKVFFEKTLAAK